MQTTMKRALEVRTMPLPMGTWTLDREHSRLAFTIRQLGLFKVRGTFADVAATLEVGASPEASALTATVGMASIDTGNARRDEHLRKLLDVQRHPAATFTSVVIIGGAVHWSVRGRLDIGGVVAPARLDVRFEGSGTEDAAGRLGARFTAQSVIRRKDFGISYGAATATAAQTLAIDIDAHFVRPAAASAA